jgi:chemotaxis response regulator CheB
MLYFKYRECFITVQYHNENTEHKQITPAAGNQTANENVLSKDRTRDFPIVGIGASAGGLEAMELFFKNMPQYSGMAFVVIQHLDPTHVEFYRNYCNAMLWKYYRSLIDLKYYLIIST